MFLGTIQHRRFQTQLSAQDKAKLINSSIYFIVKDIRPIIAIEGVGMQRLLSEYI